MCAVLGKGPAGTTLNGCYANRNSDAYKQDLGAAVVQIAAAVPHGMLLFFASYAGMRTMLEAWQGWPRPKSLWQQLQAHKPIFEELRGGGDLARVRWLSCSRRLSRLRVHTHMRACPVASVRHPQSEAVLQCFLKSGGVAGAQHTRARCSL